MSQLCVHGLPCMGPWTHSCDVLLIRVCIYVYDTCTLIRVHKMYGRVDPNGTCIKLVSSCLSNPFPPPTDNTTLLVARYLLIKTLVARQLLTNVHVSVGGYLLPCVACVRVYHYVYICDCVCFCNMLFNSLLTCTADCGLQQDVSLFHSYM